MMRREGITQYDVQISYQDKHPGTLNGLHLKIIIYSPSHPSKLDDLLFIDTDEKF